MKHIYNMEDSYIITSVGLYTIQITKYYGFNIIITYSIHYYDFIRFLSATVAFNYRDVGVVENIKTAVNYNLKHVFDTISNDSSSSILL